MVQAKNLYLTLRDDPDLEIPEGDSRESAAWNEMVQRVRQHSTNTKALSMGNESAVEKFRDFIEIEKALLGKKGQPWKDDEGGGFFNEAKKAAAKKEKYYTDRRTAWQGSEADTRAALREVQNEIKILDDLALDVTPEGDDRRKKYMETGDTGDKKDISGKPLPKLLTIAENEERQAEVEQSAREREHEKAREASETLSPREQETVDKVKALKPRTVGTFIGREGRNVGRNAHNIISVEINGKRQLFSRQVKSAKVPPDKATSPREKKFGKDHTISLERAVNKLLTEWVKPHTDPVSGVISKIHPDIVLKATPSSGNGKITYDNTDNPQTIALIHTALQDLLAHGLKNQENLPEEKRNTRTDLSFTHSETHREFLEENQRRKERGEKPKRLTGVAKSARKTLETVLQGDTFQSSAELEDSKVARPAVDRGVTYRPINGIATRIVQDGKILPSRLPHAYWDDHAGVGQNDLLPVLDVVSGDEELDKIGELLASTTASTQAGVPYGDQVIHGFGTDEDVINSESDTGKGLQKRRAAVVDALTREGADSRISGDTANKYLHHNPDIAGETAKEMHEHHARAIQATGVVHPDLQETLHNAINTLRKHYEGKSSAASRAFNKPTNGEELAGISKLYTLAGKNSGELTYADMSLLAHHLANHKESEEVLAEEGLDVEKIRDYAESTRTRTDIPERFHQEHDARSPQERAGHHHLTAHNEGRTKATEELSKWSKADKKKWLDDEKNSDAVEKALKGASKERLKAQEREEESIKDRYGWEYLKRGDLDHFQEHEDEETGYGKGRVLTPKFIQETKQKLENELANSRKDFEENEKKNESQNRADAENSAYLDANSKSIKSATDRMHKTHNPPLRDEEKTSHEDSKMMTNHGIAIDELKQVTTSELDKDGKEKNPNFISEEFRQYVSSVPAPRGVRVYPGLQDKSATWYDKRLVLKGTPSFAAGSEQTTIPETVAVGEPPKTQTALTTPEELKHYDINDPQYPNNKRLDEIGAEFSKSFLMKAISAEDEAAYDEELDAIAQKLSEENVVKSHALGLAYINRITSHHHFMDDPAERMKNLGLQADKLLQYHEDMGGHPLSGDDDQLDAHVDNLINDKTDPVAGHDPRNLLPQKVEKPDAGAESDAGEESDAGKRVGSKEESTPTPPTPPTKEEDKPVGEQRIDDTAAAAAAKPKAKAKTKTTPTPAPPTPVTDDTAADAGSDAKRRTKEAEATYDKFSDHFKAVHASEHGEGGISEEEFKNHLISNAAGSDKSLSKFKVSTSKASNTRLKRDKTAKTRTESIERTAKAKSDLDALHADLNRTDEERDPSLLDRKSTSKAEAKRLLEDHDGDREAATRSVTDRYAREDAANTLPKHLDSKEKINEAMFGVTDPTEKLAGRHPTRNENRGGGKATSMTRDLLAHFDEYGDDMSPETRKALTERLAQLVDPTRANKGFKANKGERFADIQHAKNQLDELREKGVSPSSDEGKALLDKMDESLATRTKNFEANHVDTKADHENNKRVWDHGNSNHTHQFDEDGNSTGRTRHNPDTGEREAHDGEDVRHSRVKEHHDNLSDTQASNLNVVHASQEAYEDVREGHSDETRSLLSAHNKSTNSTKSLGKQIARYDASQKKGLQGKHGEEHASKTRLAETKKLESADKVRQAEAAHEKSQSEREKIQGDIDATHKSETTKRIAELVSQQTSMTREVEDQASSEARVAAQQEHQDRSNANQKTLSANKKALNAAKAGDQKAQSSVDELSEQLEEAEKFRETKEGRYGSKNIGDLKAEHLQHIKDTTNTGKQLREAGVSNDAIRQHHDYKDQVNSKIDRFTEGLDEGQSTDDYVHPEEDHDELTTGPPDPEIAKQMAAQGYEWHEDTRRWRHKETHDDHVKANGIGNGTLTAGNHSASGGAHGYMATASMGADGQVTATPDPGNFAITPAGTHAVTSNLGGSPPTSPKAIQSHKLGQAMNNAGITHNGTSSTFNLKHIADTGIHESENYKPPTGAAAGKAGAKTKISRFATEAGYNKQGAFHQIITNAPKLAKPLINRALGRKVEKAIDMDNLTSVELLQLHVALQKEKEHTLV